MKNYIKLIISLVVCLTFCLPKETNKTEAAAQYSGEELFSGIYFGDGEVGKLFPEVWEKSDLKDFSKNPEVKEAIKSIISELEKNEEGYFENFRKAVTSGNHIKVKNQLNKTNSDIQKLVETSNSNGEVQTRAIKPGFVVALGYAYVGVTHIAAALALTVVAAGTKVYVGASKKRSARSASAEKIDQLTQDQYVNLIVERVK